MTYDAFSRAALSRAPVFAVKPDQSILHGWAVSALRNGFCRILDDRGVVHLHHLRYVFDDWRPAT